MPEARDPLFMHPEPGPRFSVSEAARRIAETNEPVEPVANQIRTLVQRNLVEPRDKKGTGRTAHNLFAWADLATAKILRTLAQFGIADNNVLRTASLACYSWKQGEVFGGSHPITAALYGFAAKGECWQFRLDLHTNDETGERETIARVYNPETTSFPAHKDPNVYPMGSIMIPIYRFAPRILANTEGMN